MKARCTDARGDAVVVQLEGARDVHRWSYNAPEVSRERVGDALVAACLLPAMRAGEPLEIDEPVSPRLLASVEKVQDVFGAWRRHPGYDRYQRTTVVAMRSAPSRSAPGRGAASFFTAGVDSFYTVLRHRDDLDALVYVRGFDVRAHDTPLDARVAEGVRRAADQLGLALIVVQTDLRDFSDQYCRWDHYHGGALASVAHLLAPLFSVVYVPATQTYLRLDPLGSHPLLDPLWSSESVELVHDGGEASRLDKLARIAAEPAARHWLRVCWENRDGRYNCGRCEKCLRTMVAMDALGILDRFDQLPHEISTGDIARVRLPRVPTTWEDSLSMLEGSGHDPAVARALRRRLYGRGTRAVHRAVHYAHRVRALIRE